MLHHGINLHGAARAVGNSKRQTFDILYSGGLTKHKGIHNLIQAFRSINNLNVRLHIVGGGVYEKELRNIAAGDGRINFHGKFPNTEMRKFYQNADVVVVPSICYDVRPNVIPEAYSNGVPVIGAAIGGIPELVIENRTGFLFKSGDIEQLKHILETVINNPQILKNMTDNCLKFVKQFEMSGYLDRLLDIYRQTIEINKRKKEKYSGKADLL